LPVGQCAGQLQCADHHREDAERLDACRLRIVRRQAGADVVDDGQQAVGVGLLDGTGATPDLVEQGGGRAPPRRDGRGAESRGTRARTARLPRGPGPGR
jgi:hypothetical protein